MSSRIKGDKGSSRIRSSISLVYKYHKWLILCIIQVKKSTSRIYFQIRLKITTKSLCLRNNKKNKEISCRWFKIVSHYHRQFWRMSGIWVKKNCQLANRFFKFCIPIISKFIRYWLRVVRLLYLLESWKIMMELVKMIIITFIIDMSYWNNLFWKLRDLGLKRSLRFWRKLSFYKSKITEGFPWLFQPKWVILWVRSWWAMRERMFLPNLIYKKV